LRSAGHQPIGHTSPHPGVKVIPLQSLLEDEHLEVLSDPDEAFVADPVAPAFDAVQRDRLCRDLIEDHRIGRHIARPLAKALAVAPATDPWPDSSGVVALGQWIAARFALDRSAALCLAVAVTRWLGRHGWRPLARIG
jgi:hypothetical protein